MQNNEGDKNPNKKKKYRLKETDTFGKAEQTAAQNLMQQMSETLKKMEENKQKYGQWKPDLNPPNPHSQTISIKEQSEKRPYIQKQGSNKSYHDREDKARRYKEPDSHNRGYEKGGKQTNYKQRQTNNDYKNPCYKYMKDSYPIEKDNHDLADLIKKVKKMFKDQFKEAQNIKIMASRIYPMIYFEYYQNPKSQKMSQLHLRELLKRVKNSKEKRTLFQEIYGRLFTKIAKKYYNLAIFAIEKANEIKVKGLTKDSVFNMSEGNEVMFYFGKGKQNIINFTLADRGLRFFEFSSTFIQKFQQKHPDEYSLYIKFQKSVFSTEKQEVGVDLLDNQQLQSDQDQRTNFEEKSIKELRESVYKIIDKDVNYLDQIIEKKYEVMLGQLQRDSTSEKFKKIVEEHEDLTQNRQNFVDVRNQIVQKIQNGKEDKHLLKKCLKKLIIAQKQLDSKLPIVAKKKKIFQMLKRQNLLIIEGQTGSGKSTQLPQMLCEYYQLFDNPNARPVLVTQPRRLATRTLAERVAKEMGEEVGGFVDYVASAGRKPNKEAKIIFQLDRLVLDEMTNDHLLTNYSCLVIDEAHERTISIDVILGFVKGLLTKRKDFKVIVTSASMDVHLFETYFGGKTLKVSGRTFPVSITYKNYQKYKEGDKFQMVHKICRVINQQILYDSSNMRPEFKGHLLCFCSGIQQINELVKIYSKQLNTRTFEVFQLHGKVTPADQKKVFQDTGKHKFIFASRIAETAITIDGVRVVIDPGQDIELVFDQKYKVSSMMLQDITQSSAKQRAGRSGRTGPGHCFRLYSEQNFKNRKSNKIPEIKNSSLETVVLRLKTLSIHDVINFPYLQKPDTEGLKKSLEILTLIGALEPKSEKVTKIGELLIKLPIEPFLSRAIVEGVMFDIALSNPQFTKNLRNLKQNQLNTALQRGIGNTAIEILSLVINFSNLFFIRTQERQAGEHAKYVEFSDEQGDFFFLDNIYRKYSQMKAKADQQNNISMKKKFNKQLSQWINKCFLNYRALRQINELINEIKKNTEEFIISSKDYEDEFDVVKSKLRECKSFREVILSCLITSFAANLCKFSGSLDVGYTIVNQRRPIHIYGTSNLSLLGIESDWIICYDLYTGTQGKFYCKLAHKVDYQFMKNHIDSYIWKKFNVESIEKENPYYIEFTCQLPSKYLQEIKWDLRKCETDARFEFLQQLYPSICEQKNNVSFFLQTTTKNSQEDNIKIQIKKKQLNKYLAKIQSQNNLIFRHNYVGNIFINFKQGFEIQSVQFSNKEFCVEIITHNNQIVGMIESDSRTWGHPVVQDIQNDKDTKKIKKYWVRPQKEAQKKIKVFVVEEENKQKLVQYLQLLKSNFPDFQITFQQTLVDKRRKIPQTKILLHYFAGKCKKDNILIFYSEDRDVDVKQQLDLIVNALMKKQQARQTTKLTPQSLILTKRANGINVFKCHNDQYEIMEEIYQLEKDKLLTFKFQFPSFIKKFRQPQISEASKDNQEWKQEIYQLLDRINIKKENVALNVQGFYKPNYKKGEIIGEFEKKLRVDMHATLTTLDNSIYQRLKQAYDGKMKILGCQKLHVRVIYEQIISVVSIKTFDALKDQYLQFIQDYKMLKPMMNIELIQIKHKNKQKVIIKARSSQRQDFIEPQRRISSLFAPKLIKLQASQFKFLDKMDAGNDILYSIEEKYKWKIYFGMSKHNNSLKVFCEDNDLKDIENLIKDNIKKFKYYSEGISYKGKNLKKVKQLLERLVKNIQKNEYLAYQIQFQYRKIHVTADLTTFERIKNEILKLSNSEKGQCPICADVMRNPYKMINCNKCVFCWLCITEHLRTFRNNPSQEILCCPDDSCKRPINMNDVRTLLTEEQFQKICDIKISRYIEKNKDKYIPCKYCEHIFDRQEVQRNGEINCEICGRIECLKCNESHPNYTCAEWKDKNNLNDHLNKLGVKQCPKCKTGIQKNGGCNHMECRNCQTHICWKCLKNFSSSKECYDHLAKYCGGIMGPQN